MNSMKKYVVSNSLQDAHWQNSEIVSGDVAHLFPSDEAKIPLQLLNAETLGSGVLDLAYAGAD